MNNWSVLRASSGEVLCVHDPLVNYTASTRVSRNIFRLQNNNITYYEKATTMLAASKTFDVITFTRLLCRAIKLHHRFWLLFLSSLALFRSFVVIYFNTFHIYVNMVNGHFVQLFGFTRLRCHFWHRCKHHWLIELSWFHQKYEFTFNWYPGTSWVIMKQRDEAKRNNVMWKERERERQWCVANSKQHNFQLRSALVRLGRLNLKLQTLRLIKLKRPRNKSRMFMLLKFYLSISGHWKRLIMES